MREYGSGSQGLFLPSRVVCQSLINDYRSCAIPFLSFQQLRQSKAAGLAEEVSGNLDLSAILGLPRYPGSCVGAPQGTRWHGPSLATTACRTRNCGMAPSRRAVPRGARDDGEEVLGTPGSRTRPCLAGIRICQQLPPLGFQPRSGAAAGMTGTSFYEATGIGQDIFAQVLISASAAEITIPASR